MYNKNKKFTIYGSKNYKNIMTIGFYNSLTLVYLFL